MLSRSLFIPRCNGVFKNIGKKSVSRDIGNIFFFNYNVSARKKQPFSTKRCTIIQQKYYFSGRAMEKANSVLESDQRVVEKCQSLKIFDAIQKDYLKIEEVVLILQENMCEDLCVIKVDLNRTKFHYVDYFVVTSGRSLRHLKSMAFLLCSKFKKRVREMQGASTAVVEGEDCSDWLVLDIGNIVVHFMLPETRVKYELEKLWTLGPAFDDQLQQMLISTDADEGVVFPFKSKILIGRDQTTVL